MDRPSSITTSQVILWIQVGFGVLGLCLVASLGKELAKAGVTGGLIGVIMVIVIVKAAVDIGCAIGIGNQSNGARITAIVVQSIAMAGVALNFLSSLGGANNAGGYLCGLAIAAAMYLTVIISLSKPESREWCTGEKY